ncbi:MAG: hypothetical protein ACXAEN_21695 [Candidatus Thorarchaeota archaeon]|jgi:hypothetical protein
MATPVRYPSGVGNSRPTEATRNLPVPSLTRCLYFFDDFIEYSVAAGTDGSGDRWNSTSDAEGVAAMLDADGGQIRLIAGSADNEKFLLYSQQEFITLEAGRRAWFGIKCAWGRDTVSQATLFGLIQSDTDPLEVTDRDGVYFITDGGDTNVDIEMIASSSKVASATAIDTVPTTMTTYEWEFDGVDTVSYFIDGVQSGSITSASFPTTELGLTIGLQPTSNQPNLAACPALDIDWVYAAKERLTPND